MSTLLGGELPHLFIMQSLNRAEFHGEVRSASVLSDCSLVNQSTMPRVKLTRSKTRKDGSSGSGDDDLRQVSILDDQNP